MNELFPQGLSEPPKTASQGLAWEHYTVPELLKFQEEIRRALPPTHLADLDLEREMLEQYHAMSATQAEFLANPAGLPPNQLAALANSISSMLIKLADRQKDIYTSERLKKIEKALLDATRELPDEVKKAFLDRYAKLLEGMK